MASDTSVKTLTLTALAMVAFAANSVLCRLALAPGLIDAAGFTLLRVVSGAIMLAMVLGIIHRQPLIRGMDWRFGAMLCTYMVFFSFAYLSLSAGTGALILFGCVQFTMISYSLWIGERLTPTAWAGLGCAVTGLVYLIWPGVTAPDPVGSVLMGIAGIAWGIYSLLGRGASDPLAATARSFLFSVPIVGLLGLWYAEHMVFTTGGVFLAMMSGVVASGCGYVIWYAALRGLRASSAASVQLSVPVIAAIGGAVLLSEDITTRMVIATVATLGGIAVVLTAKSKPR